MISQMARRCNNLSSMTKTRFIIVGSGWRSLFYVRIAKALPQYFELCAMLCRIKEKAGRIALDNGIHTTVSENECIELKPDLVVVAVDKTSLAEVSMHWMEMGYCVLCETPAGMDEETLGKLLEMEKKGARLVINEQYRRYPVYSSLIRIAKSGLIGEPRCLDISVAHEYHAASLIRAFLNVKPSEEYSIRSVTKGFETTLTRTRYEVITDGRTEIRNRTFALVEFESGKTALYDFDSEQYRSPIRHNFLRLTGTRGEIYNNSIYWLDEDNLPHHADLVIRTRKITKDSENPNLREYEETTEIGCNGQIVYTPPFGLCGLSDDETAMASMLYETGLYAKKTGNSPYSLEEAVADARFRIRISQNM